MSGEQCRHGRHLNRRGHHELGAGPGAILELGVIRAVDLHQLAQVLAPLTRLVRAGGGSGRPIALRRSSIAAVSRRRDATRQASPPPVLARNWSTARAPMSALRAGTPRRATGCWDGRVSSTPAAPTPDVPIDVSIGEAGDVSIGASPTVTAEGILWKLTVISW